MIETRAAPEADGLDAALQAVREALSRLSFGEINIIVHDQRIVQFDVTEKRRFAR